jgi:molybdenum cofactor guanylyltransferase
MISALRRGSADRRGSRLREGSRAHFAPEHDHGLSAPVVVRDGLADRKPKSSVKPDRGGVERRRDGLELRAALLACMLGESLIELAGQPGLALVWANTDEVHVPHLGAGRRDETHQKGRQTALVLRDAAGRPKVVKEEPGQGRADLTTPPAIDYAHHPVVILCGRHSYSHQPTSGSSHSGPTHFRPIPTIVGMHHAAGIVLAGGRSTRMGSPKAALEWHGSPILRRVTGIVARAVDGPVIVVRAPGQQLPELSADVEIVADVSEGRGPLQGLAGGLRAIGDRASIVYLSSTDVPLLHPAFVARVVGALGEDEDVVLPEIGGHRQPLAAAYRTDVLGIVEKLISQDRLKPAFIFDRCRVLRLGELALLEDSELARLDPTLSSVQNLNEPADYRAARALPAPEIVVERFGNLALKSGPRRETVRAYTLGAAARAIGLTLDEHVIAALNGDQITRDAHLPLVTGDALAFLAADAGG